MLLEKGGEWLCVLISVLGVAREEDQRVVVADL